MFIWRLIGGFQAFADHRRAFFLNLTGENYSIKTETKFKLETNKTILLKAGNTNLTEKKCLAF